MATGAATIGQGLFLDAVCVLFDDRIGEDFGGDALNLGAGSLGGEPIGEGKREILALPHGSHLGKTDLAQGILDGLALRIEDRCLQRDIDMRLHFP